MTRAAFIETYTGRRFQPLSRKPQPICIEDIARALSNQCRFFGHVKDFYSVAQHSVHVAAWVAHHGGTRAEQIWALLHDASEAYLGDLVTPLKASAYGRAYLKAEKRIQRQICRALGLPTKMPEIVKRGDAVLLATEVRSLKFNNPIHWARLTEAPWEGAILLPMVPNEAEQAFLRTFKILTAVA
jgi:uncharacterized protein